MIDLNKLANIDMGKIETEKQSIDRMMDLILGFEHKYYEEEMEFINSMWPRFAKDNYFMSDKQKKWLEQLYVKAQRWNGDIE